MNILKQVFSSHNFTALSVLSALASGCCWHLSTTAAAEDPFGWNAIAAILAIISAALALASILTAPAREEKSVNSSERLALVIGRVLRSGLQSNPVVKQQVLNELDAISSAGMKNKEFDVLATAIKSSLNSPNNIGP